MQAATSTPVSCNGVSDGTITAGTVAGGNSSYQYSINGTTFQISNTFSGLAAGNYTVTVKDSENCSTNKTIQVTQPTVLTMQAATSTPVSCNGVSDGTITAGTVAGGNSSYQYSINGTTFQISNTFSGLAAGNYTVTVKDSENCSTNKTIEVTQPALLTMQAATSTPVSCNGVSDGTITAGTVAGGNSSYQYSINGTTFQISNTFSGLAAGNYTVTVKDSENCSTTKTIEVTQPDVLTMQPATYTPVSCNGESDGTITAGSVAGGNTNYQYSIDGTNFQISNTFSGLAAGNYTITVKDSKNCSTTKTIEVTQPAILTMQAATSTPVSCNGSSDGTITAGTVAGGNTNYQYSIDGTNFQISNTFFGLAAGTYTITVKDSKNCSTTQSIEVTQPAILTMQAAAFTPVSCNGARDGTITAGTVAGGNTNYQYSIDGINFQITNTFSGLAAGNYTITVKDSKNCSITQSIEVTQPAILTMQA